jgi:hypothetical protein
MRTTLEGGPIPDALETELAALARATTHDIGAPLRAVAVLAALVGELEPDSGDAFGVRRHRSAARRLAEHAVLTAACVHGAFGDRPGVDRARSRVLAALASRARRVETTAARALGSIAGATLKLPALEEDWQLGAIAFVDEAVLRTLYEACLELAAVWLREAVAGGE